MANAVYTGFLQAVLEAYFLAPSPDLDVYVVPVDEGYTFNASHVDVGDLGETAVAEPAALTGVTLTNGIIDADDMLPAWNNTIPDGTTIKALVVFASDGDEYSKLMCYIDSGQEMSLPLIVNGNQTKITWNPQGIMKI